MTSGRARCRSPRDLLNDRGRAGRTPGRSGRRDPAPSGDPRTAGSERERHRRPVRSGAGADAKCACLRNTRGRVLPARTPQRGEGGRSNRLRKPPLRANCLPFPTTCPQIHGLQRRDRKCAAFQRLPVPRPRKDRRGPPLQEVLGHAGRHADLQAFFRTAATLSGLHSRYREVLCGGSSDNGSG